MIALVLMVMIFYMGAPGHSLAEMATYLIGTGLISGGLGIAVSFWLRRGPVPLWLQMTLTYALGVVIAIINIFLTVQLMIISSSALPLLVMLLLFAGAISLGLGISLAQAISGRVIELNRGARALAAGDLQTRVEAQGSDEIASLAREFNRMAEQLATATAARERQEAARRDLIAAVSHDLRTPLTALRGMVEAIADGLVDDPATLARYRNIMRNQIDHLSHLIDDLFELSRLEADAVALNRQRLSVSDLVSDTINALSAEAAARGIELRGETCAGAGSALLDPQRIERVLYNLVTNGLRHTPSGGTVTIKVGPSPAREDHVVFSVTDTGEGILASDLPHIFERFYRGEKSRSRATGGAGLGLAIARGIVEAHGGTIGVTSERGKGACFSFSIPRQGGFQGGTGLP